MNASKVYFGITILAVIIGVLQLLNILYWGIDSLTHLRGHKINIWVVAFIDLIFLAYIGLTVIGAYKEPAPTPE